MLWQLAQKWRNPFAQWCAGHQISVQEKTGCTCRFCLIQGNGKHQDGEGLSIPWLLSTAFATVLDLKGFMESREEEPGFRSSLCFASKKLYMKSWQYKTHVFICCTGIVKKAVVVAERGTGMGEETVMGGGPLVKQL